MSYGDCGNLKRVNMFEKESKEYANKWLYHVKDLELHHKSDEKPEYIRILEAHQKGAEFGYNKANEWHYVKDGLPKETKKYFIYSKEWGVEVRKFFADVGYFECRKNDVIAWKEIVLPKEEE